jgi:hypothetical protein
VDNIRPSRYIQVAYVTLLQGVHSNNAAEKVLETEGYGKAAKQLDARTHFKLSV